LEEFWQSAPEDSRISTWIDGKRKIIKADISYRSAVTKLLDYHAFSENARTATAAPRVVEFLTAIFETKPKAFQSLTFWKGSQQPIHKDTAYVQVDGAPMIIAASWLALEDIESGTGELEYYVGSHRGPEFLFGGEHKWKSFAPQDHKKFLQSLHDDAEKYGFKKGSFLAKEGDVLIWHADLAHGGSEIQKPGRTRQSLVTHFTSENHDPPYQKACQRTPVEHNGILFIAQHKQI
jgi:ectoine hydroxylase-related dioxygenase (phytanoyl-CoA dioxygenase family)